MNDELTHKVEITITGNYPHGQKQHVRVELAGDGGLDHMIEVYKAALVAAGLVKVKSGLSESCDAVLAQWDMYATPKDDGISAEVYDCEGEYQTTVRRHIGPSDLLALLRYGRHRFNDGNKQGAESMRAGLRAMLGAAPLEPLN